MTQCIPKLPRQQPQGIFQGRDGYRLPSLHDYAAMVRIILNCSCLPPQGKAAVFFKTGFDLPAAICYHQNAISGYDGIGRHARFRFSCRETCRFDPCYPHHVRRSKHRSVSALRRKLHYVSSFFLTNSSLWETGSDYLFCPLSAQPKPGAAVRARECRKVFFRTMQRCFFRTTALLEIEGGQTLLVPARLYGF